MGEKLELTESDVQAYSSNQSFTRGLNYYNSGAIFETIRRGDTIEARCEGSEYTPYRVTATLGEEGITGAFCTCPYDWGGYCKHIIALLLTYIHEPTAFTEQASHQANLEQKSQEELIALVLEMVDRNPELAILLDRPQPTAQPRQTPLDTASYRRELRWAIDQYEGWGDHSAEETLYRLNKTVDGFATAGDWQSASAICRAIIEEVLSDDYYQFDDEGSFLDALSLFSEHLAGFARFPELSDNPTEREAILKTFLDIILWDIEQGGIGFSDHLYDPFDQIAIPDDLSYIEERIQPVLDRKSRSSYGSWGAQALTSWQLELQIKLGDADPDDQLARLYEEGFYALAVQRLIEWDRISEATEVTQKHLIGAYERLQATLALIVVGHADKALPLVEESLAIAFDERLAGLALELYQQQGDQEKTFNIQWQQMMNRPSVERYIALQQTGEQLERWEAERTAIIKWLNENNLTVLTKVYLHEKDWDTAWATLQEFKETQVANTRGYYWHNTSTLELEYAEKAYDARPYRAVEIYKQEVQRLIGLRGRGNYHTVAIYLGMIREIYRNLDETDNWKTLIQDIREEFRRLPALQDELNKARL